MQQEVVQLNSLNFLGVLNACASVITLEEGHHVHHQIIQSGLEANACAGSSLVDMYANVGALRMVQQFSTRCYFEMWSLGAP
jgi:hypothetical protein